MSELNRAKHVYDHRYRIDFRNRDYDWHPRNPISLVHAHLLEWEVVRALNDSDTELVDQSILDVGCGYGRMLRFFAELGAEPAKLHGCDLMQYRLERAKELSPRMNFLIASAGELPYESKAFGLVSQFAVFSSIIDTDLRQAAANEMFRVLMPGGRLLWYDIAIGKDTDHLRPVTMNSAISLFSQLELKHCCRLFTRQLTARIERNPRLAMLRELVPLGNRTGLLLMFQRLK